MSVTDGIGQTPCSLEHYLVLYLINIRGHGENIPYSSSELNESDIVNRQSGGRELKYILKFYIGGTNHVIRACAMTI